MALITCRACKVGALEPVVEFREFNPPAGRLVVELLRSKCDQCDASTTLASQHSENLARLAGRQSHYGKQPLGEEIFAFRRRYGLPLTSCAAMFGIGAVTFSRYENEKAYPKGPVLVLLRLALAKPFIVKELADMAGVPVPLWEARCEDLCKPY